MLGQAEARFSISSLPRGCRDSSTWAALHCLPKQQGLEPCWQRTLESQQRLNTPTGPRSMNKKTKNTDTNIYYLVPTTTNDPGWQRIKMAVTVKDHKTYPSHRESEAQPQTALPHLHFHTRIQSFWEQTSLVVSPLPEATGFPGGDKKFTKRAKKLLRSHWIAFTYKPSGKDFQKRPHKPEEELLPKILA